MRASLQLWMSADATRCSWCVIKLSVVRCRATLEHPRLEKSVWCSCCMRIPVSHLQRFLHTGWEVSVSLPGYNYCCVSYDLGLSSSSSPLRLMIKQSFRCYSGSVHQCLQMSGKGKHNRNHFYTLSHRTQAKSRAASLYKCQMWETVELFLFPVVAKHTPVVPSLTSLPVQRPGQHWPINCLLIAVLYCDWNIGNNRGKPGSDVEWGLYRRRAVEYLWVSGGGALTVQSWRI